MKHILISLFALLLIFQGNDALGQMKKASMPKGNLMSLECSAVGDVPDPFYYFKLTNENDVINAVYWSTQVQKYTKVTMDVMVMVKMRNVITRRRMFEYAKEYHNEGGQSRLIWHLMTFFSKGGHFESTGYNYIPDEDAVEDLKNIFKQQLNEPSTQFVSFVDKNGEPLAEEAIEEYQNDPALRPKQAEQAPALPLLEVEEELEELVP